MIDEARGCDPTANDGKGDCGSRLALPYFISYTIVASFVFLNLVVAFGKIVRKKRELWAEHPERHPSHPDSPYQAKLLRQSGSTAGVGNPRSV